ncbi:Fc.00g115760.m01.CDS01 [Cosmosporella sp. VM-42]
MKHTVISPAILYWGTPVVVISSLNEDGSSNLAPMSSAWWIGHSCMLGLDAESKTTGNILRTGQCVLNLADDTQASAINLLAGTTGADPVSASKSSRNYRFVYDKWAVANLTHTPSDFVKPDRVAECAVQMECEVVQSTPLRKDLPDRVGLAVAIEVRVLRVHLDESLRMAGYPNRVDPDQWRPLIMSFQELYGLRRGKVSSSVLGSVCEEKYRALTRSDMRTMPGDHDDDIAAAEWKSKVN